MPSTVPPWTLGSGPLAKLASGTNTTYDVARVGAGLGRGPSLRKKSNAAAWSNTWPAPQATLDLDFANDRGFVRGVGQGKSMDAVTFTRASNGNYVKSDGTLSSHANQGALGNNLLTFPQDFDNAYWTKNNTTVVANTENAPDGTLTADKVIQANGTDGVIAVSLNFVSGVSYTASVYAKKENYNFILIALPNAAFPDFNRVGLFNLNTGQVATASQSGINATIVDVGNGWYRCSITQTADATQSGFLSYAPRPSDNLTSTGNGVDGIYIWGAQLEVGSTATTYYPTNINVPRFDWASTAQKPQNLLLYTEDFSNSVWVKDNSTISTDATTAPDGTNTADLITSNATTSLTGIQQNVTNVSAASVCSISVKSNGVRYIQFMMDSGNTLAYSNVDLQTQKQTAGTLTTTITAQNYGFYRINVSLPLAARIYVRFVDSGTASRNASYTGNGTNGLYVWGAQLEVGSAATTYIANGAYSATNTPLAANPTCNGLLIEESRANRLLWCRDATNAAWTKTNVTAAKDQTGIDGVANSASSLTATSAGGTCIQTITLASGSRTGSVYLKRITGTGNVQVTLDGSTWSTVDLSNGLWNRIVLSGTVTNPTVGIRLATNGDAVAMDYGQIEDGAFATSPILTTTASVTRSADVPTVRSDLLTFFMSQSESTFYAEIPAQLQYTNARIATIYRSSDNFRFADLYFSSTGTLRTYSSIGSPQLTAPATNNNPIRVSYASKYGYANLSSNDKVSTSTAFTNNIPVQIFNSNVFGIGYYTGNQTNGCIKRLVYIPKALPQDILISMVTST